MRQSAERIAVSVPGSVPGQGRGGLSSGNGRNGPVRGETTLAEKAYRRLRLEIIAGVLKPHSPLRLEMLKERYGLSFSPLREALNRLQAERLVVPSESRGFRVAGVSLDEMWDAIETRILIDVQGLRRSIERGDDDWEASVLASFHAFSRCAGRLAKEPADPDGERWEELEDRHRDFHLSLVASSGSRWLVELSQQLYAQTERYRRPMMLAPGHSQMPPRDFEGEHRTLMEAAVDRDADRAALLLDQHYRRTGELIERHLVGNDPRHI